MKKTKYIPPILALSMAALTAVVGFVMEYEPLMLMVRVLVALLVFFFLGHLAKEILDMVQMPNEEAVSAEGEVIEKGEESEEEGLSERPSKEGKNSSEGKKGSEVAKKIVQDSK